MFYSERPPHEYAQEVSLFFSKDVAHWNLLWLFYPRMDLLNSIDAQMRVGGTHTTLSEWMQELDTDLTAACQVDLEREMYGLREQITTLSPTAFMDWLWQQPYTELLIYRHLGMAGMQLATKRAQWLDKAAANPPSAEIIKPDFKRRT